MKKKLLLMLIIAMMLGVVGCSDKDEAKEDKSGKETLAPATQAPQETAQPQGDSQGAKTLGDLFAEGYDFRGYSKSQGNYTLHVEAPAVDEEMAKLAQNLEGKTVAELRDEYDMTISYSSFGDEYEFSTTIGTITYEFEIEHGVEALKENEDEVFYDLEEDDAVQDDKLKNVKVIKVAYNVTLDAESEALLNSDEDNDDMDYIEDNADKLVIKELKCELE